MDETPNLSLPYIMPAQAQKHVTHNEAIRALDAVVQLSVVDRDRTTPPAEPVDGARYIVAASPSGAWVGKAGQIAAWQDGAWAFFAPKAGWLAWVADEQTLLAHDGGVWRQASPPINPAVMVGVNTVADATNKLAVKSDAVLLSHDNITPGSGDVRLTVNKAGAAKTASLVFQDAASGRAELGLAGDDDFRIKVSADGATWKTPLNITATADLITLEAPVRFQGAQMPAPIVLAYAPTPADPLTPPRFNLSFSSHLLANGPVGEPEYWNHTAHMGWNFAANERENAAKPAFGLSWESRFHQGGVFANEFHIQGKDANGTSRRWFSMFLPHSGTAQTGATFSVDNFNLQAGDGTPRLECRFASGVNTVSLLNGVGFQVGTNNTVVFRQRNAAGTAFLNLPFIDNFNRVSMGAPVFVGAAAPDGEYNSGFALSVTTMSANRSLYFGRHDGTVTGDIYGLNLLNLNCSGKAFVSIVNNNNATGSAILEAAVLSSSTGDALTSYWIQSGGQPWSVGVDNSDSDSFKISRGWQRLGVGDEDRMRIDDARAEFFRPLRLRNYTVATLPSAATAGAGALVYVTNAAGGPTLAASDGTDWRVVEVLGAMVN